MNKKCLLFFMIMLSRSISQRLLLLFMISMFCQVSAGSLQMLRVQRILSEGWMIRQVDADTVEIEELTGELIEGNRHWMAVDKMPRQVAEVLLEHGKIADPHQYIHYGKKDNFGNRVQYGDYWRNQIVQSLTLSKHQTERNSENYR